MDIIRCFWRRDPDQRLLDGVIRVVVQEPFPLGAAYQASAREHGITLAFVGVDTFCADPLEFVRGALASTCQRVGFVLHRALCPAARERLEWPLRQEDETPALYVFDEKCGTSTPRDATKPEVVDLS